jgi:hypothetical protein
MNEGICIITVTNQPERAKTLIESATKQDWPIYVLQTEWRGFGTKLIATYEFLKAHPEITHFVFCDAHDVAVLGTPEEFLSKLKSKHNIIFNAERGCWPPPVQQFQYMYKEQVGGFNFLNSGVYFAPSKLYMEIFEYNPPQYSIDDQWLWSMIYLFGRWPVELDSNCDIFQCYSFFEGNDDNNDYNYCAHMTNQNTLRNALHNKKTDTFPIFIHANGGGGMQKVLELLNPIEFTKTI